MISPGSTYNLDSVGPEKVPNKCLLNEWMPVGLGSTALTCKHPQGRIRNPAQSPVEVKLGPSLRAAPSQLNNHF